MVDESTHSSSVEDNISQSNNNVKSSTLSNNSNMQDNIKYSLSGKEFKPTKYCSVTIDVRPQIYK